MSEPDTREQDVDKDELENQDADQAVDAVDADDVATEQDVDADNHADADETAADEASTDDTQDVEGETAPVAEATVDPLIETMDAADLKTTTEAPPSEEELVAPDVSDLPPAELRAAVEAVLFVATKPLTMQRLQRVLPGTSTAYLEGFLTGLATRYDKENRGWELRHIAGGWQLLTRRELHPWVRQLDRKEIPNRLSKSALETLAIVAYKQPLTRGAIEDIRGVQCGPVLRQLMDVKLVFVSGREEEAIGRPLLYSTTDAFLSRFGLGRIEDLPRRHEFGA